MIASPIIIAKQWFIIVIVQIQNLKKQIFPYAIRLFSKKQIQEMTENKPVHDNTEIMSQEGNKNVFVSNSSPESVAKVLQKYLISNRIIANKSKNNNS